MPNLLSVVCLQAMLLAGDGPGAPLVASVPQAVLQPPAEEAALFASPTRLDRIGRVVAPVMINGRGPFRLVVDTGASHSTFSPRLVQQLGLTLAPDATLRLNGVTGVADVPTVLVDRIEAGDVVFENTRAPVIYSSIMADADGILGVAGLRTERILVDFRNDKIAITRSGTSISTDGFLKIPARRVAGGLLQVRALIGGVPANVVIDTGAERSLGNVALKNELHRAAIRRKRNAQWNDTQVFGATSEVSAGQSAIGPSIRMGAATISGTEIVYGDFHIFKVWEMEKRPGALIGMDVIGTVEAMVLDYRKQEIWLDVTRPKRK
jgi:predicted aspartyl protease